jgi:GTPase SAR1 family protein
MYIDKVPDNLGQKFKILVSFLAIAPIVGTGLLFYPFMRLITFWQYRTKQVQTFTSEKFQLTAPFRWQSFAYPLPHLRSYLVKLAQQQDIKTAFDAIQQVQLWTLQMSVAREAAQELASHPETAINFCGEIVLRTNNATVLPLATTGKIGRAIAILTLPGMLERVKPITLWINDYPPKATRSFKMLLAREQPAFPEWFPDFQTIQEADLAQKLEYALNQLKSCQHYQEFFALQELLATLRHYAEVTQLNEMLTIAEQPFLIPKHYPQWMHGGWFVLQNFIRELADFPKYRPLESAEARRQYLTKQQQKLNALNWEKLPDYWATIGQELIEHWVNCLEQGKKQTRNFLHLEIDLPQASLFPGQQQLNLRVFNRSTILGENIVLEMQQTADWHWINRQAEYQLLEGKTSIDLHFDCHINKPGPYIIRGQLTAQDLDGHRFHQAFDFQIIVAEAGHIYKETPHQLYIVGECINSDQNFFGRADLLAWLGSLWRIPDGKSTVVLIGQRRIGKSSLLHKIQRSELDNTQLLPVYIDCQGIGDKSAYSFLATVSNAMSKKLGINQTPLSQETPYLDFKNFLESLKILLEKRRFLLMLDESEPIFHKQFDSELPNFLRSLMQQPEYPTVLLFCGTYFLKQVAWDYSSVFFNTAHFKTLSYLSKEESAELLQKTAQDFLEFGPDVLEQAYALTCGQPYLLQNLGAKLIETFNTEFRKGKERSNYVNFKDLRTITKRLVKEEDNAAFRDHWKGSNSATHRVLSALAWATQNMSKPQLDINGILAAIEENQLEVSRKQTYEIIQNLRGEEILEKKGQVYRFVVPLYRQWIAYWYEPDLVREEGLED